LLLKRIRDKGNRIQTGWNIHLGSGIRAVPPGATEIGASLQQDKVINIFFFKRIAASKPEKPVPIITVSKFCQLFVIEIFFCLA
jgi:hypothetical protein